MSPPSLQMGAINLDTETFIKSDLNRGDYR